MRDTDETRLLISLEREAHAVYLRLANYRQPANVVAHALETYALIKARRVALELWVTS